MEKYIAEYSPYLFLFYGIINNNYLLTKGIIYNIILNIILKYTLGYFFLDKYPNIIKRPYKCFNHSILGMPSGHAQIITYIFLYFRKYYNLSFSNEIFLGIYCGLIIYGRYYYKCHTIPQIISGIFIGYLSFIYITIESEDVQLLV